MSQYVPTYDGFGNGGTDRYVPTARFQVLSSVYLPASDVDPMTGVLKPDRQRRCRTQGKRLEIELLENEERRIQTQLERETQKGGVRISTRVGLLLTVALVVLCGFILLIQQGTIANRQKEINLQERNIASYKRTNDELKTAIAEASSYEVICYAASRNLGMIPAKTAEAIHLVAMDTRPLDNKTVFNDQQQTLNVNMTADAAGAPVDNGGAPPEATSVPAVASN